MIKILVSSMAIFGASLAAEVAAQTPVEQLTAFYKVADARPYDSTKIEAFLSENFVDHDPAPGSDSGRDYVLGVFSQLASGAPDSKHVIEFIEPIGENKALIRWQYVGTHTGTMFGLPASGNKIDISGFEVWEYDDNGKAVGLWHIEELATLFQQLAPK